MVTNKIFKLYGIPDDIIEAKRVVFYSVVYTKTTLTILSTDAETTFLPIKASILQGDTLAPFLFIMVVDYIMRESK